MAWLVLGVLGNLSMLTRFRDQTRTRWGNLAERCVLTFLRKTMGLILAMHTTMTGNSGPGD
jgi:hypothetical protein